MEGIQVRGARAHNLRNVDVDLPRNALVVLTGVSGSGKSSLAIDTIFAEGQRRFLESLPAGERRALRQLPRPDVDAIHGLPPTVSIDQRQRPADRRSTLSTLTGIADFLRLLFARTGAAHCPGCGRPVSRQSPRAIVDQILRLDDRRKAMILAPWVRGQTGEHRQAFQDISQAGFVRARVDGEIMDAADPPQLAKNKSHEIEAVVDRIIIKEGIRERLQESVDLALKHGGGTCLVSWQEGDTWHDRLFSERFACPDCERSFPELEPRSFSFNSPYGACLVCNGLGVVEESEAAAGVCPACQGERLNEFSRAVTVAGITIGQFTKMTSAEALGFVDSELPRPSKREPRIGAGPDSPTDPAREKVLQRVVPEIANRLRFLLKVGLDYLTLDRPANTLSGGEFQRTRLAACLGTGLRGACYVLDEPTAGLHPRDTRRLMETLFELRDQGNSVLVVEHDLECMRRADWLVDLGPGAGAEGGKIIASATPAEVADNPESITAKYLRGTYGPLTLTLSPEGRGDKAVSPAQRLTLSGARRHNLKNVTLEVPLGKLVCVTGVSGSGKSSLISETLVPAVRQRLAGKIVSSPDYDELKGFEPISQVIEIDQTPLGRSAVSTPATYSGMWDEVRKLYAKTRDSRVRGFKAGRFSFNSRDGRCPECKGRGTKPVEMDFLPDAEVECPVCRGARFNRQTLSIKFRGKSVADVLAMPVSEALEFFRNFDRLHAMLSTFAEVGLGYLLLGQSAPTLSGGEAQRVKLATELARGNIAPALFVLDEPTLGLHPADVDRLLQLLHRLVESGHSAIVVEHHEDVMAAADWIIDLGPEGGDQGGEIIAAGIPAEIAQRKSPTGEALRGRSRMR